MCTLAATIVENSQRWQPHVKAAALLRAAIILIPLGAGFLAGATLASRLVTPTTAFATAGWWVLIIGVSSLAAHLTDRLSRKLLPLTVLLKMTMAFPDQAPSRFKVALRSGNVTALRRQIHHAIETDQPDLAGSSELVLSLATALSAHDRKTRGHSERTRAYTDLLAEELKLNEDDRDKLRWAALLHDVGKLEVPEEILNKDGPLTDEEYHIVRQHPVHGMRLVAPIVEWLGPWAQTIEHHHERYDGRGYPYGLQGTRICFGARIVSVADAYDVMTTGRSYQQRKSHSAARQEIAKLAGDQFDPRVARALMNLSMGRLRWATGPLSGLADFPFLRPLEALGRDVVTLFTASAVTAAAAVSGVIPLPVADLDPDRAAQVVVASLGLTPTEEEGNPIGPPLAAAGGTTTSIPAGDNLDHEPQETTVSSIDPTTTTTPATTNTTATTVPPTTTTTPPTTTQPPPSTTAPPPPTTQPPPTTLPPTTTTVPPPTTTTTTQPPSAVLAVNDQASTRPSDKVNVKVLGNDSGDLDQSTLAIVGGPSAGSANVQAGQIRYQAPGDFTGAVTMTYQICGRSGSCSTATVTVVVG